MFQLIGLPSPLENVSDRFQCAEVEVPLNYEDPNGKKVSIAISRIQAQGPEQGVIFTNPGGPGLEGRTLPRAIEASAMADITRTHTLVGIDVRGTGGSTSVTCNSLHNLDIPEIADFDQAAASAFSETIARANIDCVAEDPDFFSALTTQNAARDMNTIREAMGLDKVSYFGVSWGTELGIEFRSQFPQHIERMLLDSVTDISGDARSSLDDIAQAREAFEAHKTNDSPGFALPDYKIFDPVTRSTITCNAYSDASDAQQQWRDYLRRAQEFPRTGSSRPPHPLSSAVAGVSACTGWPHKPRNISARYSHGSLQLVGHLKETVTPAVWTQRAQQKIGGHLFMIDNGAHGSLSSGPHAQKAVEYLQTGKIFVNP
ncbi:alpha/beta fold hydrolase [Lysinibacter sp. HNR]|uniref:alpha/beta fold hydrolase n=1 Tax=Lysinibacter sp. HNR TaxID=3031408 RepID=UPI0024352BAE|nr:alpha/beta fold hydrolase [Lysinibacter sp. HNR]WGD36928.1 alpha/beta fold hydrolase [Lysinibacter sp. HNR]